MRQYISADQNVETLTFDNGLNNGKGINAEGERGMQNHDLNVILVDLLRRRSCRGSYDVSGASWRKVERMQRGWINCCETRPCVNQSAHANSSGNGLASLFEGLLPGKAQSVSGGLKMG